MGEWGEPAVSVVCAVVCALVCFCANLYQLWIFIDMLFLCLGALQGRNTILSLWIPGSPSPTRTTNPQGPVGKGLAPSLRIPQSCDSSAVTQVLLLR